ncbi:MAG: DMT family transporter [Pikeienuella sp.]
MNLIKSANAKGILLMTLAMACLATADTFIKMSSSFLSPGQIGFYLVIGAIIVYAALIKVQRGKYWDRRALAPVMIYRYLAEVLTMGGIIMALSHAPLSTVGAISQASPILVAVGAVLFLGEKVSWRRWTSIAGGFLGVLLVLQPGAGDFNYAVLWSVMAVTASSVRDLLTRLTPPDMPTTSLTLFTMIAILPITIIWVLANGEPLIPTNTNWLYIIAMTGLGAIGYMMLTSSVRIGEISAVMPFRYSRMIFILLLSVAVFNERPGALVLIGAALIVGSGVFVIWREQQVKRGVR